MFMNRTCRNCKHEFCWLCKGDWTAHGSQTGGYYKCNTYESTKDKGTFDRESKDMEDAKNKLQKYAFYFQRYQDHDRAAKFAEKTIQQTEAKMEQLHERGGGDIKQVLLTTIIDLI
jgi:ariadne-1